MAVVSFRRMTEGTSDDFKLLERTEAAYNAKLPERLIEALLRLRESVTGYQVTRYEHSLQSATRAHRNGESDEYVVAALLHDIGDDLAPVNHGEMVGAILKPYVAPDICWVVVHHGVFQQHYYGHFVGLDSNARDRYRNDPRFDECVRFCDQYDQNCFDPDYDSLPLDLFIPMVNRVFSEPRYIDRAEAIDR